MIMQANVNINKPCKCDTSWQMVLKLETKVNYGATLANIANASKQMLTLLTPANVNVDNHKAS